MQTESELQPDTKKPKVDDAPQVREQFRCIRKETQRNGFLSLGAAAWLRFVCYVNLCFITNRVGFFINDFSGM